MLENNNEISIEQTKDESEEIGLPEQKRKVFTEQGDPEIQSLYGKWKDGDLDIQPDFQRGFVWDIIRASRLIESTLLDIPLPVVYLSQENDGKEYVIDGQQRLTSFFSFIDGSLPDPRLPKFIKDFKLTGLNVFSEYNGKFFKDLPKELQKKIRYYKIRTITFRKESEKDLKFEIFERLNTGSVSLNDQELRNCIYRGKYNDLLWELSEDKLFQELLGIKKPERRMRDVELVLRFSAFFHNTFINYKPPIKKFLNSEMEKFRNISDKEATDLRNAFKNSITVIKSLLGVNAFKRFYPGDIKHPNGYWEPKKFNASLYDILMDSFARRDKNKVYQNLDAIRESYIDLLTSDQKFIDAIELSTSSTQAIHSRFNKWNSVLDEIVSISENEPRLFSIKLKEKLFKANPYCAICNNKIQSLDDGAVDHIEQYWKGGQTIPENARLTHRYCNNARDRGQPIPANIPHIDKVVKTRSRRHVERIITIDGDKIHCKNSLGVLVETANWLIRKGKLKASMCPIKFWSKGKGYLINTSPYHGDGRKFIAGGERLLNDLYLDKNWSQDNCIKWSKELLSFCEMIPSSYDLDE